MSEPAANLLATLLRHKLDAGEIAPLTVRSGSMAPLMPTGERIGIAVLAADDVRVGEIYTFYDGHTLTTHRLMEIEENGRWLLRGDRLWKRDHPQPREHILGRVVWVERSDGRKIDLTTPDGRRLNQQLFNLVRWRESLSPSTTKPPPQPLRLFLHWSEIWGAWQVWRFLKRSSE